MVYSVKAFHLALLFVVVYFGASQAIFADTVTFAIPDFNRPLANAEAFPPPPTLASLHFTLPVGFRIGSGQLGGTFNDSIVRPVIPATAESASPSVGLGNLILTVISIPEPTTLVLFATGLAALGLRRRKSR